MEHFRECLDQLGKLARFRGGQLTCRDTLDESSRRAHCIRSLLQLGEANGTVRSRRGGARRSIHSRIATVSPLRAMSMALRVIFSASPSRSSSMARETLLRDPAGRPVGFPL